MMKWHETIPLHPPHTSAHLYIAVSKSPSFFPSLSLSICLASSFCFWNLEILQAVESFFSSYLMRQEHLVLPGRQKRRRNERNERISRFLLRSEDGVFKDVSGKRRRRQPIVQFRAVKNSVSHLHFVCQQSNVQWCLKEEGNHVWLWGTEQGPRTYTA